MFFGIKFKFRKDRRIVALENEIGLLLAEMFSKVDLTTKLGKFVAVRINNEVNLFLRGKFANDDEKVKAMEQALENLKVWNACFFPQHSDDNSP